jgi:hypothetical protein
MALKKGKAVIAAVLLLFISGLSISACSNSDQSSPVSSNPGPISSSNSSPLNSLAQSRVTSELRRQISLRQAQIANPTPERLAQMQIEGMNTTDLSLQRIYIYLKAQLTPDETSELQTLGVFVFLNTWISPQGINPDGFYLADLPVDKLESLSAKVYIVKVDTAEKSSQPQFDLK